MQSALYRQDFCAEDTRGRRSQPEIRSECDVDGLAVLGTDGQYRPRNRCACKSGDRIRCMGLAAMLNRRASLAFSTLITLVWLGWVASAQGDDLRSLRAQLVSVNAEITDIESQRRGDLSLISQSRLEVLTLSRALLQQEILARTFDAERRIQVPVVPRNLRRAERLETEIRDAEQRLDARIRSGTLSIEARSLEYLALAKMRLAYVEARYGVFIPRPGTIGAATRIDPGQDTEPLGLSDRVVSNQRLPSRDDPVVGLYRSRGFRIVGWWALTMSDFRTAINLSELVTDGNGSKLEIRCEDGSIGMFYTPSGMTFGGSQGRMVNILYRIGEGPFVAMDWTVTRELRTVEVTGAKAARLIDSMSDADQFSVRLLDQSGYPRGDRFNVAGMSDVVGEIRRVCPSHGVRLSRSDFRLIQGLLTVLGHSVGEVDGIWGRRSRQAMAEYQRSVGLEATGMPDGEVLKLLGLRE